MNGNGSMGRYARLIANVGFPIVVTGFLLWRLEEAIDNMAAEINAMALVVLRSCGLE